MIKCCQGVREECEKANLTSHLVLFSHLLTFATLKRNLGPNAAHPCTPRAAAPLCSAGREVGGHTDPVLRALHTAAKIWSLLLWSQRQAAQGSVCSIACSPSHGSPQ